MITKQKGTIDLYGEQSNQYVYLEMIIHKLCNIYNYNYIKTPTFEASELFKRGVGETTDIVTKETYDFVDRGGRNITLKPEGTASVVRSFIENKMDNLPQPTKFYYLTPVFRYERPQSGRLREHTQFGVEVFGSDSAIVDAEVISMAVNFYKLIGLKGIKVKINSLGDTESRLKYKEKLIEYLTPHKDQLCLDCQNRLEKNPLRVLDCKVDALNEVLLKAPKTLDYLNDFSLNRFQELKSILDLLQIEYIVDPNLVRGLDYYNHTVFEIQASIEGFGSQNTLCGGGRYNGLVSLLGGKEIPAIGFGMGMERLLLALEKEQIDLGKVNQVDLYVANLCTDKKIPYGIVCELRMNGYKVETDYMDKTLKGQFKQIERLNPKYFTIIGDDEISNKRIIIKNNVTKKEKEISLSTEDIDCYLNEVIEDEN